MQNAKTVIEVKETFDSLKSMAQNQAKSRKSRYYLR